MYDSGKIITGLVLFSLFMLAPALKPSSEANIPKPELPKNGAKQCVKDKAFMRTSHMVLLNQWRDEALRLEQREKITVGDQKYDKSLQKGCMKCHSSKKKFCDTCHTYTSVSPYCWDCHLEPQEPKEAM